MRAMLQIRFMLWQKQLASLLLWLFAPLLLTLLVVSLMHYVEKQAATPIAIVLEDDSDTAKAIFKQIASNDFLQVNALSKTQALAQLETHTIDSVFVILPNFEEKLAKQQQTTYIESYYSDLSFMFEPVNELVFAVLLQNLGKQQAITKVQQIAQDFQGKEMTANAISNLSDTAFREEALVQTQLSFATTNATAQTKDNINILGIWAIFSLLVAFFSADWLIKERQPALLLRLPFSRWRYASYIAINSVFFIILFSIFDGISLSILARLNDINITTSLGLALICYRICITLIAIWLATYCQTSARLYQLGLLLSTLAFFTSGISLPITQPVLQYWQPVYQFTQHRAPLYLVLILFIIVGVRLYRKERQYATTTKYS